MTAIDRWRETLGQPVDGASLAAFRILFGLFAALGAARFLWNGWVEQLYLSPSFFFTYPGFSWAHPWPGWGMYAHFVALIVLGLMIAAGIYTRLATGLYFVAFTYVELLDQSNYLNHYYLISLLALVMTFMPLGRVFAVDGWRSSDPRQTVPIWCVWLIRFQLAAVYFFAGLGKVNADWLLRAQPLATWLPARGDVPVIGPLLTLPAAPWLMSWAGAAFDLFIPLFLLHRRTRFWAWLTAAAFHVITGNLFKIGLFPWIMIAFTLVFFEPDWPRTLMSRLMGRPQSVRTLGGGAEGSTCPGPVMSRVGLAALCLYAALQIATPLRHIAYPSQLLWSEEGFMFSWRVMLVEKAGQVDFWVHTEDGRRMLVPPRQYLSPHQLGAMSTQPELIQALAAHIAAEYQHLGDVRVTADAFVSLNGRPRRRLIEEDVDLASAPTGLGHRARILPLDDRQK